MRPSADPRAGDARPRLQLFVSDLKATGVVRNVVAIANAAAADGFAVRLLACIADGPLRGELSPEVHLVELLSPADAAKPRYLQQRKALAPYRRHTREWRPDVLFSGGNHGHLLSTLAWLGARGTKILRISNDLTQGPADLPRNARWTRALKFRWLTSQADRLVLVSPALDQHGLLGRLLTRGKAIVIPNGVNIAKVQAGAAQPCPHPWTADKSIPLVLAVGRHVEQKNYGVLLEAVALANRTRPLRLLFVGEGKPEAIADLRRQAEALRIGESVAFEPPVANPFCFMAAADVFVLPSLWEGASNVLLEAIACGTPVVASRTAGNAPQVLDEGRYGLLVDPSDPAALASAILRQAGPEAVRPGTRAESFSKAATLERYLRLFRESLPDAAVERLKPA